MKSQRESLEVIHPAPILNIQIARPKSALTLISSRDLAQKVLSTPSATLVVLCLRVEAIDRVCRILIRVMLSQISLVELPFPQGSTILVLIGPL